MAWINDNYLYMLLNRLQNDCKYWLGYGNRCDKYLWAGNPRDQIAKMRAIYAMLPEKPEWLTSAMIDDYEARMIPEIQKGE